MTISEWKPSDSEQLAEAYNVQAAEIPYDYPVDHETFVDAFSRPNPDFSDGRLLVSEQHGHPQGFIHVGTVPSDGDSGERDGLIRHLCFPRDRRDVGQALLERAYEHLGPLASTCQAFNYRFGYTCTWYSHLKSPWEHVYALLGSNGYEIIGGWGLIMVLRDYEMPKPVLPDRSIEVHVSDDPVFPHLTSHGDLPTVVVRLFRGENLIGGNETRPYYLPHWDETQQDTCCTIGMGVNQAERGRGLGRYRKYTTSSLRSPSV